MKNLTSAAPKTLVEAAATAYSDAIGVYANAVAALNLAAANAAEATEAAEAAAYSVDIAEAAYVAAEAAEAAYAAATHSAQN